MSGSIFILGAGAVGASIGRALANGGIEITGVYSRGAERATAAGKAVGAPPFSGELPQAIRDATTVIASVPDPAIEKLAERAIEASVVSAEQVWLHCAGGLSAEVLEPLRGHVRGIGTLHPALAFPRGVFTAIPEGASFTVDGDEPAIAAAGELIEALGGHAVRVPPEQRVAYHAALVLGSNYQVALLAEARESLWAAGLSGKDAERLLTSLGSSALAAVSTVGIDAALTGPISRGDAETVQRHLAALAASPDAHRLYQELGRAALRIARDRLDLSPEQLAALSRLLEDRNDK